MTEKKKAKKMKYGRSGNNGDSNLSSTKAAKTENKSGTLVNLKKNRRG